MLLNVFDSPSAPFYKSGDIMLLVKISSTELAPIIIKRFLDIGKRIELDIALLVTAKADCHPCYVQQLVKKAWLRCTKLYSASIIEEAFECLLMQLSLVFQIMRDNLPTTQINFLKAVIENAHQSSSSEIILKYSLVTSANVIRIKKASVEK
jgi:uncharacterized protein